jgi:hypothetical protein
MGLIGNLPEEESFMSRKVSRFSGLVCLLSLAVLAIVQLPGCGGGGSGSGAATVGTLKVALTDKQSDSFANVFIAIKEVRVVPAGLENAADNDARLPVIVTYDTPHVVDVLTLHFQQDLLGSVVLLAGTYNQVRLILAPNPNGQGDPVNYLTMKTAPTVKIPLTTPSAQQSGLKVLGSFAVKPGIINAVLIDFDPNTAIVARGNGAFNLKPTGIRIVQPTTGLTSFGSLSGTVVSTFKDWSSATVSVVPQAGVNPVAAGIIFSNFTGNRWEGPFSAFVPGGTYRVHLAAKGFAPYSSPIQTVTAGIDFSLGDIFLKTP